MNIYNKVIETLSSGLFLFILTSSWTFLFFGLLPLGYGYFALPIGLVIGILSFLFLIKLLSILGLVPDHVLESATEFQTKLKNKPKALPSGDNSKDLDFDELWKDIDVLDIKESEKEKLKKIVSIFIA